MKPKKSKVERSMKQGHWFEGTENGKIIKVKK